MSTARRRRPHPPETSPFLVRAGPGVVLHAKRLEYLLLGVVFELLARRRAQHRGGEDRVDIHVLEHLARLAAGLGRRSELQPVRRLVVDRIIRRLEVVIEPRRHARGRCRSLTFSLSATASLRSGR